MEKKRYTGKISHINHDKGWGFITSIDVPFKKIYFYWESLLSSIDFQTLKRNERVEFTLVDHPERGLQARDISLAAPESLGIVEAKVERIK